MDHAAITAEQVLGKRVAELRQARGWSQDELARRMTDAGFHWRQTTVAKTEKADRPVRVNEAATLMQLFGVDIDYLVTSHQSPVLLRRLQLHARRDDLLAQLRAVEAEISNA